MFKHCQLITHLNINLLFRVRRMKKKNHCHTAAKYQVATVVIVSCYLQSKGAASIYIIGVCNFSIAAISEAQNNADRMNLNVLMQRCKVCNLRQTKLFSRRRKSTKHAEIQTVAPTCSDLDRFRTCAALH